MKKSYFLSMTFNNVVFKGRNQAYGAYVLRRVYNKHLTLAAIIATAIFSGALVGPLVENIFFADQVKYVKPVYKINEPFILEQPNLPKLPEPPKKEVIPVAPKQEKKVKTEKFVTAKVVADNEKVETATLPDQDLLSKVSIGKNTIEGDIPEVPGVTLDEAPVAGIGTATGEAEEAPAEFIHVQEMPEFVGGDKALFAYLSKQMRYPAEAQRAGVEGIVVVTFVVAMDGAITKAEIVKGLGSGTDEEALRVINKMPRWKPGKQNGRNVPVRYTLPIKFNIQ
ncbi:energy transducer TonB [Pontibacter diazotrophicus]|uniref:Energy transducer TonB n=1 Tax=Pontibacter diazotrophicus TaxID=1400979 RepID=A0A3D8L9N0_9BACT|nr:energy transducer TonB [Pontibacter diazotrophicus]RDV14115.1 energy transducer TonB [Pontibacter diazotrophicus]